jgi:hypothetical protein
MEQKIGLRVSKAPLGSNGTRRAGDGYWGVREQKIGLRVTKAQNLTKNTSFQLI